MTVRTFDKAPATVPLLLKAALPAVPVLKGLPGVRHASGSVPSVVLQRRDIVTDLGHLDDYNEVCGFPRSDFLPVTYPHMAAFALHLRLMTDTAFPFTPMGLVHLRNSITQHRKIRSDESFDLNVRADNLRPHPKGQLIDVLTEARIGDQLVWNEVTTLFARGKGGAPETSPAPLEGLEIPRGVELWKLKGDLGRRYGAVSGDRNPIHLYPITAKAFGFPRNIAHGMWTKARCLASLHNRVPDSFAVDVEFKKPILLPARVVFGQEKNDRTLTFGVTSAAKPAPHLIGRVSPLP